MPARLQRSLEPTPLSLRDSRRICPFALDSRSQIPSRTELSDTPHPAPGSGGIPHVARVFRSSGLRFSKIGQRIDRLPKAESLIFSNYRPTKYNRLLP